MFWLGKCGACAGQMIDSIGDFRLGHNAEKMEENQNQGLAFRFGDRRTTTFLRLARCVFLRFCPSKMPRSGAGNKSWDERQATTTGLPTSRSEPLCVADKQDRNAMIRCAAEVAGG
jgi:hypothetical protein